jgi:hypothetical protein
VFTKFFISFVAPIFIFSGICNAAPYYIGGTPAILSYGEPLPNCWRPEFARTPEGDRRGWYTFIIDLRGIDREIIDPYEKAWNNVGPHNDPLRFGHLDGMSAPSTFEKGVLLPSEPIPTDPAKHSEMKNTIERELTSLLRQSRSVLFQCYAYPAKPNW